MLRCAGRRQAATAALFQLFAAAIVLAGLGAAPCGGTPPEYESFNRTQKQDHAPDEKALLRIWVVFVDQGDGILIELPKKFGDNGASRNVIVDGGPQERMLAFLKKRLPGPPAATLGHVVLTHHDQDHVKGLTALIDDGPFKIGHIYHNGLASYAPGENCFVDGLSSDEAVFESEGGHLKRGMAFLEAQGKLREADLINDLDTLEDRVGSEAFETKVYGPFARAVAELTATRRTADYAFERAKKGNGFITIPGTPADDMPKFELLWPHTRLQKYGNGWSETISGSSVSFRLDYGKFSMLFTGDHNDKSEPELLKAYENAPEKLKCDVLKVPHHGSAHGIEKFFKTTAPVVAVASMGNKGFGTAWKHPSPDVVQWLGGAHRVYHTFVHERKFTLDDLASETKRKPLIERTHILIESDGTWFRIVEVDAEDGDVKNPPTVEDTRRGNGTRWINAEGNE